MKLTQKQKLIGAFRNAPDQTLSMGYIERELYMSQGNSRLKDLKEDGYHFADVGKDEHGFKKHQLISEPGISTVKEPEDQKLEFGNTKQIYEARYKR